MQTRAVILQGPRDLSFDTLALKAPEQNDVVVEISHSAISTGTEKLFWTGDMPPFPGMGYPLVPGYEAFGEIVEAPTQSGFSVGDHVFVPGANCYKDAFGLFGGSARHVVTSADRVSKLDKAFGPQGPCLRSRQRHVTPWPVFKNCAGSDCGAWSAWTVACAINNCCRCARTHRLGN